MSKIKEPLLRIITGKYLNQLCLNRLTAEIPVVFTVADMVSSMYCRILSWPSLAAAYMEYAV